MSKRSQDLALLDPTFRLRVEQLLARMKSRRHDAYVFEAWRSLERAAELAERGTGVKQSMHCYGLAVDILDRDKLWSPGKEFWRWLGREAAALGLTWGGTWTRVDKPHVQALPAYQDGWVRRATPAQVALMVAHRLK